MRSSNTEQVLGSYLEAPTSKRAPGQGDEMTLRIQDTVNINFSNEIGNDILQELKMVLIINYIRQYHQNLRQHVNRMSRSRIPKAIVNYLPNSKRSLERKFCVDRNSPFRTITCLDDDDDDDRK